MKPIVILGIFVADAAFRADRLPMLGKTLLGQGFALGPGGKGSNQAVAAARAAGQVHLVTRLGRDDFAGLARSVWDQAGVRRQSLTMRCRGCAISSLRTKAKPRP